LDKLSGGVDFLVILIALNCWYYRVSKACYDVLDRGVVHIDVFGGREFLFAFLDRGTENNENFELGLFPWVVNELHLGR
jgi:hypothetical protein